MEPVQPQQPHGPPPLPRGGAPNRQYGYAPPTAPVPVQTLEYGRTTRRANEPPGGLTFFHQAAKASWVAPLIALVLGFCTLDYRRQDREGAMVIGVVDALLIVGGFVLAIVAFFGIKKHGTEGILGPAIAGLLVNGLLVAMMFTLLTSLNRARVAATGGGAAKMPLPITSPQAALRQTGWVGTGGDGTASVVILSMPDDHQDTIALKSSFNTNASILVLTLDNRQNNKAITVSTDGATLHFADGSTAAALKTSDVVQTVASGSSAKYRPPYVVNPGEMIEGRVMFLRPGTNVANLRAIDLTMDGERFPVTGEIVTAAEKTNRLNAAQGGGQPAPQN